jgi:hypothetical protein
MLKPTKSVSAMLLLMTVSAGTVYAEAAPGYPDTTTSQKSELCSGVVIDSTGEPIIGASVTKKGSKTGTVTGIDGDFSLAGVKPGDVIQRYPQRGRSTTQRGCCDRSRYQERS